MLPRSLIEIYMQMCQPCKPSKEHYGNLMTLQSNLWFFFLHITQLSSSICKSCWVDQYWRLFRQHKMHGRHRFYFLAGTVLRMLEKWTMSLKRKVFGSNLENPPEPSPTLRAIIAESIWRILGSSFRIDICRLRTNPPPISPSKIRDSSSPACSRSHLQAKIISLKQ